MNNKTQILMIGNLDTAFLSNEKYDIFRVAEDAVETVDINRDYEIAIIGFDVDESDIFSLLRKIRNCFDDIAMIVLRDSIGDILADEIMSLGGTDLVVGVVGDKVLECRINNMVKFAQLLQRNNCLVNEIERRGQEFDDAQLDIIIRLGKAAEYRDEESGKHILRVGCYSRHIAEKLGMEAEFSDMLFLAAPLHDIGKIGVPDKILLKPGKLDEQEFEIMQRHCNIGVEILKHEPLGLEPFLKWQNKRLSSGMSKNPLLEMASQIALSHHEKWNGSGYPQGLKGTEIPLAGRIVALADVYDALRSERPYKPAFDEEKCLTIMRDHSPGHFDPMVFDAFESLIDVFDSISRLFGDSGKAVDQVVA
ncbi:MAG: HD domain-containing protein [Phycisphaerae bacterium]|nr:HD domain-containing protein [Phycisphaerae bacterium]